VASESETTPLAAPQVKLHVLDVAGPAAGEGTLMPLAHDWDRWAHPAAWLPDGSAVLVTADEDGAAPVFRIGVAVEPGRAAEVTRLTADAAAYSDVVVAPNGRSAYALRSSYEFPAEPVRIDLAGGVVRLPAPAERPHFKGTLERVETEAADGARVPAYLALPEGASAASPAPLLLWIHGGSFGQTDPLFHNDIGFYVFALPFYSLVRGWAIALVIIAAIGVGAIYLLNSGLSRLVQVTQSGNGQRPGISRLNLNFDTHTSTHLSILGVLLLALISVGYWLGRFDLLYSSRAIAYGAGYTEVNARLPALNIMLVV
jgi:hypothetical protein